MLARRLARTLALAVPALLSASALAQDYVNNFDTADAKGAALYGSATLTGGRLRLTEAVNSQNANVVLPCAAESVNAFSVAFTFRYNDINLSANGISFNLGILPDGVIPLPQASDEGPGNGLSVHIDLFDFNNDSFVQDTGLKVFYNGVQVAGVSIFISRGVDHTFLLELTPAGVVNVTMDGVLRLNPTIAFVPQSGQRMGFSARTGGENSEQLIDDVTVAPRYTAGSCATAHVAHGDGLFEYLQSSEGAIQSSCNNSSTTTTTKGVYFAWLADSTGSVTVSTVGHSNDDTVLNVRRGTGPCPNAFGEIACNDDAVSVQSRVTFDAVAGATYLIRVGMFSTNTPDSAIDGVQITTAPSTDCGRDFNHDGSVDPDDLGDYINVYFGGCP